MFHPMVQRELRGTTRSPDTSRRRSLDSLLALAVKGTHSLSVTGQARALTAQSTQASLSVDAAPTEKIVIFYAEPFRIHKAEFLAMIDNGKPALCIRNGCDSIAKQCTVCPFISGPV